MVVLYSYIGTDSLIVVAECRNSNENGKKKKKEKKCENIQLWLNIFTTCSNKFKRFGFYT